MIPDDTVCMRCGGDVAWYAGDWEHYGPWPADNHRPVPLIKAGTLYTWDETPSSETTTAPLHSNKS